MAQTRPQNQVDQDIAIIVGGSFSADHIGPTAYKQIVGRVRAAPDKYLQAFEKRFLRPGVDPLDWQTGLPIPGLRDRAATGSGAQRVLPEWPGRHSQWSARDWEALDDEESPTNPRASAAAWKSTATLARSVGAKAGSCARPPVGCLNVKPCSSNRAGTTRRFFRIARFRPHEDRTDLEHPFVCRHAESGPARFAQDPHELGVR